MDALPDDVLADVLSLLSPRSVAACRCVCVAWRAVVDARRLLRADLLPLSVRGIFISILTEATLPNFFRRPSTLPKIASHLDYVGDEDFPYVQDCCNGLLLLHYDYVVNPATRRWARLPRRPPRPMGMEGFYYEEHLVFDPTVSSHYEVLLLPSVPHKLDITSKFVEGSEWPPSPYVVQVYSSRIRRWEERLFVREGEAAGTIADVQLGRGSYHLYAAYWHGELYVHCKGDFLMRIILSENKYQVIKLPASVNTEPYLEPRIGKSKRGVYLACMNDDEVHLRIWFLNKFSGKIQWILKHDIDLDMVIRVSQYYDDRTGGPWVLENHYSKDNEGSMVEENIEWDSDNDNILDNENVCENQPSCIFMYGFHPYKEIVFFHVSSTRAIAYHLNSSKVQDLGKLRLYYYDEYGMRTSFVYTPCWKGDLSEEN